MIRGTDGDREGRQPRSNHGRAVQRGWAVSAQHVSPDTVSLVFLKNNTLSAVWENLTDSEAS